MHREIRILKEAGPTVVVVQETKAPEAPKPKEEPPP
jgi:exonuclease III